MANRFNCLEFCNAPINEYEEVPSGVKDVKCRCLTCFGTKHSVCDTYNLSAQLQIELKHLQKIRCGKCKYYNGK